jgi:hypothetical protein
MANEQFAFLAKSGVPDRTAWQVAIDDCGFDLKLDPDLRPFEDAGYLPCKLRGRDSGFEIYYQDASELEELSDIAGTHDYCISFRWGGDIAECACVMIASYVLAKRFSATVSYEGEPPAGSLDELLAETMDVLREADAPSPPQPEASGAAKPWWKFW